MGLSGGDLRPGREPSSERTLSPTEFQDVEGLRMRRVTSLLLSLGLLMAVAAPAHAHVGLVPGDIAPSDTVEAQVVLAHGCGEEGTVPGADDASSPTTSVSLTATDGVRLTPLEVEGWSLAEDGAGGATWTSESDEGVEAVVFLDVEVDAKGLDDGDQVWVPVTQECADGTVMAWDHPGTAEEASDLPAMLVRAAAPIEGADAGGLPTPVLIGLVVALAVAVGGGVTVLSMRRG